MELVGSYRSYGYLLGEDWGCRTRLGGEKGGIEDITTTS